MQVFRCIVPCVNDELILAKHKSLPLFKPSSSFPLLHHSQGLKGSILGCVVGSDTM